MEEPLNVYGVTHQVVMFKRPWWHFGLTAPKQAPTRDVEEINKHLKTLAAKGVTKIGVELAIPHTVKISRESHKGGERYYKAVCLRAQRAKLEVIDLEHNPKSMALVILGELMGRLQTAYMGESVPIAEFKKNAKIHSDEWVKLDDKKVYSRGMPYKQILQRYNKMVDLISTRFTELDWRTLYAIDDVTSTERSVEMEKTARKQGVNHIIVGAHHAFDLKSKGHNITYVNWKKSAIKKREKELVTYRSVLNPSSPMYSFAEELRNCA